MEKRISGFLGFVREFGEFTIWNKISIWLTLYNERYSEFADKVIRKIISGGEIVPECSNEYHLCVRFKNQIYYIWIENRWYAALCHVRKGNASGPSIYAQARPSRKTIIAFFEWVNAYIQEDKLGIIAGMMTDRDNITKDFA